MITPYLGFSTCFLNPENAYLPVYVKMIIAAGENMHIISLNNLQFIMLGL